MTEQEDNIILGKIVSDENDQEKKTWACLGQTCSRSLIVFLSQFFYDFVDYLWLLLEKNFQNLETSPLFEWEICVVQQDTFYPHQDYEQVFFYKKMRLHTIGRSLRDGESQLIYNWLKNGNFLTTFDKNYFLNQHYQTLYDVMQKEIESLEFVQDKNFEFKDSLNNNSTKY